MRAQLARRRSALAAGDDALGWKVGFGSPAAMERLGIRGPLVGYLTRRALVEPGAPVDVTGWTNPVAEPEIAVHLREDVEGGSGDDAAGAAIGALGLAIELADVDRDPDDVETILAGNIFQRAVVLGPVDASRAGGATAGLEARVLRGGSEHARTADVEALTGEIVGLVAHVASVLAAYGETLRSGEVVIAGSVVPPLPVRAGDEIAFELSPIGRVAVRLVAS